MTQPTSPSVNASPAPSRTPTHDPRSPWIATPSMQDVFMSLLQAGLSRRSPVHLPLLDPDRQRIQRIMLAAPRPEPIGETEKVLLVHGVQHLNHRPLDNLVLQRGDAARPLPPVRLRYVHPPSRARPVSTAVNPPEPVFEVRPQILPVGSPRHLIYPRSGLPPRRRVSRPQAGEIDVVQQRREPRFLVLSCSSAHTVQRT